MNKFCSMLVLLSLFSFSLGCSDPAKEMRINEEYPDWPELKALQSDEILMPIGTAVGFGDIETAKAELKNPEFKLALDAFESSQLPSGYDSEERSAAKEKAVKQFREAIQLAESNGSNDAVKEAFEEGSAALRVVAAPK